MFLLIWTAGLKAQTVPAKPDQQKLMLQFLGTWQANAGKDTLEVWDFQQFGKAMIINVSQVVKTKKIPLYVNNIGFDSSTDKFKGFTLMNNGSYGTWEGSFTSEKKFEGIDIVDFNPSVVWAKFGSEITNPQEWIWKSVDMDGKTTQQLKFTKVK
jgi:hypothetical protein